ncbi:MULTISPECIES: hypothetical protein [Actinoplanes]|uniref:hypothetical protein n=1 Tax=Actinoplanes TaxID=1865 RepID=UPI0012FAD337|nr:MULTISPECIES: hypothetical protein [Actinoplanes]
MSVLLLAAAAGWFATRPAQDTGTSGTGGGTASAYALTLELPDRVAAAETMSVRVGGAPIGATVSLVSIGGLGTSTADSIAGANGALFRIPSATTRWAGALTFVARSGEAIASRTMRVVPGAVVEPTVAEVGPKTIVADGADVSMMVTVPVDAWGNAQPDGTPVTMVRKRPTGGVERRRLTMAGLFAYAMLPSGKSAGNGLVGVSVGDASGSAVDLAEVAAPPLPFTLRTVGFVPVADGRSLLTVRTSTLRDAHGNVEPDGTAVRLLYDGVAGEGEAASYTVGGLADFTLEAPDRAGRMRLRAECRGTTTARVLQVAFPTVDPRIPVTAARGVNEVTVTVGPVTGEMGALMVDGTPAAVTITDATGKHNDASGQLIGGSLTLTLVTDGLTGPLRVRATVLGAATTRDLA